MDMSFTFFLRQMVTNPALLITVILTLGVICVNGITDAPNAIATCVSTRSLDVNLAIAMAAVCNCAGVVVMTMINSTVASTITGMVNFGDDTGIALVALCAALFSIVVWSSFAVSIGCPTSESHSLIAGLTGAAVAIRGGFSAINQAEWMKVIYGLVFLLHWDLHAVICPANWCPGSAGYGQAQNHGILPLRPDRRRSSYGVHAWGSGRAEVHGCYAFGDLYGKWQQQYGRG